VGLSGSYPVFQYSILPLVLGFNRKAEMKEIKVGLIGFGTVGTGVVKILQKNSKLIEARVGARIVLKRIADIDIGRDRGVKVRPGSLTRNAWS
jgi:homoserine dehydrogenase